MKPELIAIFDAVSLASGVPVAAIRGRRRTKACVWARFAVALLLYRRFPWWSQAKIAECLGRKDHGSAANAVARALDMQAKLPAFRDLLAHCAKTQD